MSFDKLNVMITLLVSSKTMLKKEFPFEPRATTPLFTVESQQLNKELAKLKLTDLQKLMHVSDNLAKETKAKIEAWGSAEGYPAWLLFSGDVYKGLVAETLSKEDLEWAQDRAWTLSGLYGIARPLDLIKPYRLEAGYRLAVGNTKDIYAFWGSKIAEKINDDVVINLSSEEYIKLIRSYYKGRIITPLFLQVRDSGTKFEAVHAKVGRGMMARWIIQNRVSSPSLLKNFCEDGYAFDQEKSTELEPVFVRRAHGVMKIKKG